MENGQEKISINYYEMGSFLMSRGLFNQENWRRFILDCIDIAGECIYGDEARKAVEIARQFLDGKCAHEIVQETHRRMCELKSSSWDKVFKLRLVTGDENEYDWEFSEIVDTAWAEFLSAALGALSTKLNLTPYDLPDSASSVVAWRTARDTVNLPTNSSKIILDQLILANFERIHAEQEIRQIDKFKEMFGLSDINVTPGKWPKEIFIVDPSNPS